MKRTCKCHGVSGSCTAHPDLLAAAAGVPEGGRAPEEKYHALSRWTCCRVQATARRAAAPSLTPFAPSPRGSFAPGGLPGLLPGEQDAGSCWAPKAESACGAAGALGRWERHSCRRLCRDCGLAVEERRAGPCPAALRCFTEVSLVLHGPLRAVPPASHQVLLQPRTGHGGRGARTREKT